MDDWVKSCGVLVYREKPAREFLLMRHHDRWDLPKGHLDPGETELTCALRELREETGITQPNIRLDPDFRFVYDYTFVNPRTGKPRAKTLVVFLAELTTAVEISVTEHPGYAWHRWAPPHTIQVQTIDPLLAAVADHWRKS